MNTKQFAFSCLIAFAICSCARQAPELSSTSDSINNTIILDDFEGRNFNGKWDGTITLSNEFPSHGKKCCKIASSGNQPVWLESVTIPGDWKPFKYLRFDIYNPSDRLFFGTIQILDVQGSDEQAEFQGQSYNGEKLFLNTGWNHFDFLLQKAMVEEGNRPLALERIRKLRFSFGVTDTSLFIDNIRLVAGSESAATRSEIRPSDCVVLIDNRDVYPSLAGPAGKIEVSSDVLLLREKAAVAVERLKNEVRFAEMQGFQTLYQRIPLITADVGMGIRSKLVWFQNEPEEIKILNHVISSCDKASEEISALLASKPNSAAGSREPENETSSFSFYVPPYPSFNELKPDNGFYRDKSGKPVMIFSMLQINEGPLLEYFAPFNHRLESYTVGGGSRYNIESSPVYRAFHSHQGTKRVGWDGWCGHLIKDRWAMGGKKEDVVICLESPHIKDAVLEYMKINSGEWANNSSLLYNIMAYELQYICFCDKSQQMFREWLDKKYSSVQGLNRYWNTSYGSFAEIVAPETKNARPLDDVNRAAWYDWADFNTRRFTDYLKWIKKEMQKIDAEVPICAGGTSSMLSSSNSVTGIDEELIINEVDDVILNESGGSPIFSDLLFSLSSSKKVMVEPEMGGGTHNLLLQFLHGKSDISKWWWGAYPSKEYMHMNQTSLPHSKEISLADIDEVLRLGLDVRRLGPEIAEFTMTDPEIAILYSKSSILQVPPQLIQSGTTPYIKEIHSVWEGSRFLGCRIGFISEKQILAEKLSGFKLLIVPAAKYVLPEVVKSIKEYIAGGGTAVIIPESFEFDQYARELNITDELGIGFRGITLPDVVGTQERKQNYDQSFSREIIYGNVNKRIRVSDKDIFNKSKIGCDLTSDGLLLQIDPGQNEILAEFEDGQPAIVLIRIGTGSLFYLASPLKTDSYHQLFSLLTDRIGIRRAVKAEDSYGNLITGAEVRSVERESDFLVYASNLTSRSLEFDFKVEDEIESITDLRTLKQIEGRHILLKPYGETIFKVDKKRKF
jgi:hypothetical protein